MGIESLEPKELALAELNKKAAEIYNYIKLNKKEYALEDFLAFSFITLINASALIPQFEKPTKYILNVYLDGMVQIKEIQKAGSNGILSIESK